MTFIKPYTKKLLKELDDSSNWKNDFITIRHKSGFEIWPELSSYFFGNGIIYKENVDFNCIEAFLITRKARKIKDILLYEKQTERLPEFFKS